MFEELRIRGSAEKCAMSSDGFSCHLSVHGVILEAMRRSEFPARVRREGSGSCCYAIPGPRRNSLQL